MTTALKSMFRKIDLLSDEEQNSIAKLLSDELKWKKSFDKTQHALTILAEEAIVEYHAKKTQQMKLK